MLPRKLWKRHILPASQNLLSVYFSLAKFQLVSCNLSLAIIWQRTYTHKLPKLCSATLSEICKSVIEIFWEEVFMVRNTVKMNDLVVRLLPVLNEALLT